MYQRWLCFVRDYNDREVLLHDIITTFDESTAIELFQARGNYSKIELNNYNWYAVAVAIIEPDSELARYV